MLNSLDAGATSIAVRADLAANNLWLQVADDGRGLGREELKVVGRLHWSGSGHSSHKELFTPGPERCGAKPSRAQVRNSSSEKCLLNLVTSGGVCPASVLGEEALLTNLKPGPEHQKTLRAKGP